MKRRSSETGYTVIEVLCGLAVMGLLASVLSITITQVDRGSVQSVARTAAATNVQSAGYWFTRDARQAQATNLPPGGATAATMTIDWMDQYKDLDEYHVVQYYVTNGDLRRSYDGQVTVVARYVQSVLFSAVNGVIQMSITCSSDSQYAGIMAQGTYEASMRSVTL